MLVFACIAPHPPIILPNVGSRADRKKVKKTILALEKLGKEMAKTKPEAIIVSSPHPDWGFNVPLYFLAQNVHDVEVKMQLTGPESAKVHFQRGKELIKRLAYIRRLAWIASGDMSHYLTKDGPYGFHPSGPKFDKKFIGLLKKKAIKKILNLDSELTREAGECGLRSFCMLLGALEKEKINWQVKSLSYEGPFGVGYLVARLV